MRRPGESADAAVIGQEDRRGTAAGGADRPLLEIRGLGKSFAGNAALSDVDLDVRPGEIVGLLGQNGAGKSTLIKILAGVHTADAGTIRFGRDLVDAPRGCGDEISFVHQDLGLVPGMTVAENIAHQAGFARRRGLIRWRGVREHAARVLQDMALDVPPDRLVRSLTAAEKSLVAIARALARRTPLVVLDEPTATLGSADAERVLEALRALRRTGVGLIYVSHHLEEVRRIVDRMVVLRDGRTVLADDVSAVDESRLLEAITGRPPARHQPAPARTGRGRRLLDIERLTVGGPSTRLGPLDLHVDGGEIVGIVGLVGAGQHTLGRAIAGDAVARPDVAVRWRGAQVAGLRSIRKDVGFASGNRVDESLARSLSVRENLDPRPRALTSRRRERAAAERELAAYRVRPLTSEAPIETLSGGNQQKVVVARTVRSGAGLMLLEDPTNGVDVGAKADIYQALRDAATEDRAVVVVTSDFEEAAEIATRVIVLKGGVVAAELRGTDIDEHLIMQIATGEKTHDAH